MAIVMGVKRTCFVCLVSWPMDLDYNECPSCGAGELGYKPDHAELRELWEARFRGPGGEMEGRVRTVVDEILYGETERADRRGVQIMGESPIATHIRIQADWDHYVEMREFGEAALGAGAWLVFVPLAVLVVLALTWVMRW